MDKVGKQSVQRTRHGGQQQAQIRSTFLYYAASVAYNPEDRKYIPYVRKSPIQNSIFSKTDQLSGVRKTCLSTMSHLKWALHMTKPFLSSLLKPKELLHILPYSP